jgi:biuret amidohydrolase
MSTRMAIDFRQTALLVIDMQRDFLDLEGYAVRSGVNIARLRTTIAPVQALLTMARSCGMRVIFTREGHRADLSDCQAGTQPRGRR